MTYPEAIQFLYSLRWFGAKFGLENTLKLAELAGNPQNQLRFIHVAGTNGKGSTCAMLEGIYRAAGLRVGLFTSPHLVSFRERIQVNRELIAEADVVRLVSELQPWLKGFPNDHHPTFFEIVTIMALRYFAEQKCDLVIWETGLGGRLDATNIVTPLASVITNIGFDHLQWLGDTLAKIAAEKAGIIKPGVPVVTAADQTEVLAVIEKAARSLNAPLTHVASATFSILHLPSSLPLPGKHQRLNAALALKTVEILQNQIRVSDTAIRTGLSQLHWPGRLQLIMCPGGQQVLLDGAHNAGGAVALRSALEEKFPGARPALILGMLADKDWATMCDRLAPLASRIWCVPVSSERTADPAQLRAACARANPAAEVRLGANLPAALAEAKEESLMVIAGSLYLIGEALECLHVAPAPARDEKGLNEWSPKRCQRKQN